MPVEKTLPIIGSPVQGTLLVSGDGVFFSKQGEGPTMGEPAVFLRLNECNLSCAFCDTKYTWEKTNPGYQERERWGIGHTLEQIQRANRDDCRRLILTGGEPLLQQKELAVLCSDPHFKTWDIEIETNGTLVPSVFKGDKRIQINCAPKLSNAIVSIMKRMYPSTLHYIARDFRSIFKFVVRDERDVHEICEMFLPHLKVPPERIWLSPEGTEAEMIDAVRDRITDIATQKGFHLGDRQHIREHGNKRRV